MRRGTRSVHRRAAPAEAGARHQVIEETGPLGDTLHVTNDATGLPTSTTGPRGGVTRYARDAAGRIIAITDPLGGVVRHGWTVEGLPAWRTAADGATERWRYDAEHNLIEHTDEAGQITRSEIGPFDEPTARITPDGARLEFGYDTELRLTTVTNAQGLVWRYTYDPLGNPTTEQDFNGRTYAYSYDPAGQLVARTNGAGQTITFTRDLFGNVTEKRSGDEVTTFTYDGAGRLLRAVNAEADLRLERDASGRVTAEICNGRALRVAYDATGKVVRRRTPSGAESAWTYDGGGHPASLSTAGRTIRFEHDLAGREVQRHIGTGTILTQQWDVAHRLTAQTIWGAAAPPAPHARPAGSTQPGRGAGQARLLQHRAYTYRPDGIVTGIGDRLAGDRRYELDRVGQVTAVHAQGWTERYAYDGAGNITQAQWPSAQGQGGYEADAAGPREYAGTLIRRAGRFHYEHDPQGRTVMRRHHSLSGQRSVWRYHWDAEDRLIGVETPGGDRWRYRYDGLGRRIAKRRLDGSGRVVEQVDFAWDGATLVEQAHNVWSADRRQWVTTGTLWEYEPGSFRPLTQIERAPAKDAPQQWIDVRFHAIVTDLVGTPSEFIDDTGEVAHRGRTTLWGTAPARHPARPSCPIRFFGQCHDQETGLNYNFLRHYDPSIGRYESGDPIGLAGGSAPHSYVLNPWALIDPLGLAAYDKGKGKGKGGGKGRGRGRRKGEEEPKKETDEERKQRLEKREARNRQLEKSRAETMKQNAIDGTVRESVDYHGRLPRELEREILSSPDGVYRSEGTAGRYIFHKGDNIVLLDGEGGGAGKVVTSYGPGGPQGTSGAAIFGGTPNDPGQPITPEMITGGNIRKPDGGTEPAGRRII